MKSFVYFFILFILNSFFLKAQVDSNSARPNNFFNDSLQVRKDSGLKKDTVRKLDNSDLNTDSILNKSKAETLVTQNGKSGISKIFSGKEFLFYYLVLLFLIFGLLRRAFAKYFSDLFRVFFRTTLKQRQIREQLLQSPLPSIFMNVFFVLTTGLYINFLLQYFHLSVIDNFWLQYFYCTVGLAIIYVIKFLGLEISGWLFNVREATDSYTFIVFIINKMMGIFLLPFLILLGFSQGPIHQVSLTLSWVGIGLLLGYRFILIYSVARNEIKLNPFHFILYIFAFELVPLLLIYKLLLIIF